MIDKSIRKLVCYGLEKELFTKRDEVYVTNRLLEILGLDEYDCSEDFSDVCLEKTLAELLFCSKQGPYRGQRGLPRPI